MGQHRLFLALHLPAPIRGALIAGMGGIADARWQDDDQLHCTVHFLGEVETRLAEDVATALLALNHPLVTVELDGLGTFAKSGRVHSLWAGISPISALKPVHDKAARLLARAGLAVEGRAYRPHVTLARFGRAEAPPPDIAHRLAPPPRLAFTFSEVRLFESTLTGDGARYDVIARYPLG